APEERILDFLDEETLAADVRNRRLLQAIAGCLDDNDAAGRSAGGGDPRRHGVRLPHGELAAAGTESELHVRLRHVAGAGDCGRTIRRSAALRVQRGRTAVSA